jgi:hypothetical protein
MSLILSGTDGLTFNNATTQASAGVVLQVVNATFTGTFSTSSSTYVDTGFSASITPKFSNSKILVTAIVHGGIPTNTASGGFGIALYRNSTALAVPTSYEYYIGGSTAVAQRGVIPINYLDSPATVSATSYKLYVASYNGITSTLLNETGITSITLMEIAA